jgi:hypothetical protein
MYLKMNANAKPKTKDTAALTLLMSTMKTSRSYPIHNSIHSNCKVSSSKMSMNHHRLFPLVLSVLMALIVQPTSAFSSPAWSNNNNNKWCFRSAGIGKSTTTKNTPMKLFRSDKIAETKTSLNVFLAAASSGSDIDPSPDNTKLRDRVRQITGVSLTALRATMRTATGISLSAIYASTLAVTGSWIRTIMTVILAPLPAWFRYFVQPFLVLYYAPLLILRNLCGPTRKNARKVHEEVLEGWKRAVETADEKSAYWPVHLDKDGYIEKDFDEVDVNEAIAESVELELESIENTP